MKYALTVVAIGLLVAALTGVEADAQTRVRGYPSYGVVSISRPGFTAKDQVVYRRLDETVVSFTFNEQPLVEALEFLATLGEVNIVLDRRKVEEGKSVTLRLKDVTLATAVNLIAEQVELKWTVKDGVVFVSDEEGVKQEPVTVVYDVRSLLAQPPDFEGPEIDLGEIGRSDTTDEDGGGGWPGESEPREDEEKAKTRAEMMDELVQLIRAVIEPGTWQPVD